ncbi:MAG: four helix bundle protein [Paludibacteraceae bacterium]|nr:four helix bundle protein [Paludibacteraceae bacterium]MBR1480416.1 four helix bundle protein [Paludibacteraceae bacterium]
MATIQQLEDIQVWQLARDLAKDIYTITRHPQFTQDYRFASQIKAAAGSIMDNIAEGYGREGNKEYIQFLYIARGSTTEVISQLFRASDVGYISKEEFDTLVYKAKNISVKLNNFIHALKSTDLKGNKYKSPVAE